MSTPPPPGGHPVPPPDEPVPPSYPAYAPYPYAPAAPYEPAGPPPSQARAGWALGLALVPCCVTFVVGAVLAVGVLSRSREDGRDHGRGLAIGALCAAGVWVALFVLGALVRGFLGGEADTDDPRLSSPLGARSTQDIGVGDCFDSPELSSAAPGEGAEATSVTASPCDGPHSFEAFHAFEIPSGDFPGDTRLEALVDRGCVPAFREFVGIRYARSRLEISTLSPTEETWQRGDRTVTCIVDDPGVRVTGSLAGARR